jgi:hypothetical protein
MLNGFIYSEDTFLSKQSKKISETLIPEKTSETIIKQCHIVFATEGSHSPIRKIVFENENNQLETETVQHLIEIKVEKEKIVKEKKQNKFMSSSNSSDYESKLLGGIKKQIQLTAGQTIQDGRLHILTDGGHVATMHILIPAELYNALRNNEPRYFVLSKEPTSTECIEKYSHAYLYIKPLDNNKKEKFVYCGTDGSTTPLDIKDFSILRKKNNTKGEQIYLNKNEKEKFWKDNPNKGHPQEIGTLQNPYHHLDTLPMKTIYDKQVYQTILNAYKTTFGNDKLGKVTKISISTIPMQVYVANILSKTIGEKRFILAGDSGAGLVFIRGVNNGLTTALKAVLALYQQFKMGKLENKPIAVVGAGPVGSMVALLLATLFPEFEIHVLEKRKDGDGRKHGLTIWNSTINDIKTQLSTIKKELENSNDNLSKKIIPNIDNTNKFFGDQFKHSIANTIGTNNLSKALLEQAKKTSNLVETHNGNNFAVDEKHLNNIIKESKETISDEVVTKIWDKYEKDVKKMVNDKIVKIKRELSLLYFLKIGIKSVKTTILSDTNTLQPLELLKVIEPLEEVFQNNDINKRSNFFGSVIQYLNKHIELPKDFTKPGYISLTTSFISTSYQCQLSRYEFQEAIKTYLNELEDLGKENNGSIPIENTKLEKWIISLNKKLKKLDDDLLVVTSKSKIVLTNNKDEYASTLSDVFYAVTIINRSYFLNEVINHIREQSTKNSLNYSKVCIVMQDLIEKWDILSAAPDKIKHEFKEMKQKINNEILLELKNSKSIGCNISYEDKKIKVKLFDLIESKEIENKKVNSSEFDFKLN